MTARTTRRTFTLGAVATTAGALALALIPATVAHAGSGTPVFSYIDVSGGTPADPIRQLAVDDVFGSNGTPSTTPVGTDVTKLTASGIQTYTYDVSPDGKTIVVAARTGSPTANPFDSTFGTVVIHDDGVTRTSTLVAQFWDANPVLSNNGATVWWLADGTLWSADSATGTPSSHGTAFAPSSTESAVRLAVSSDGTMAAVMYHGTGTNTTDRVLAAPVATGKSTATYAEISYPKNTLPVATIRPNNSTFVWRGSTTLIYGESDEATPSVTLGVSVDIPASQPAVTVPQPKLDNFYDLRLGADGATWWMWKDTGTASFAYSSDDSVLFTGDPAQLTPDRGNGDSTFRYVPSAVAPPALGNADHRAVVHTTFGFSPTTVKYGARSAFQTIGLYGGIPGTAFLAANAAETDHGQLWSSTNGGVTWTKAVATSGASVFPIGTQWYNGRTAGLTRNTWFKWTSDGDAFTLPFTSAVRKVSVLPTVKVAVTKYANGTRRIAGSATRKAGSAQLWRFYSGAWHKLQTVTMNSVGGYNFGTKARPRGTYKVVTVADVSWASGFLKFSF